MPFRNYRQFDVKTISLMTEAYDAALLQLGITGDDPMSGELAAAIAMLADAGERDPDVLCTRAVERLKPKLATQQRWTAVGSKPFPRSRWGSGGKHLPGLR
jgi:hypothetical protein